MIRHAVVLAALGAVAAGCGSAALEDPLAPVPTRVDPEDIPPAMLRPQWKVSIDLDADGESDKTTQPPALGPQAVFLVYDDELHARELVRGQLRWTAHFARALVSAPIPLPDGGVALLTDRRLVWLDDDGAARATVALPDARTAAAIGNQILVADEERLHSYLLSDGSIRAGWTFETGAVAAIRHAPDPDLILVTTSAGALHALDRSGAERWTYDDPPLQPFAPAVENGRLYALRADTRLVSIDAATGRQGWSSRPMGVSSGGAPAVRDRVVWVPALDGALHGLTSGGGSDIHRVPLPGRSHLDLAIWQRWVIASPGAGPLTLVHAPMSRMGPADPGQPRIEVVAVAADLEHAPATAAGGVLVTDSTGAIRLLTPLAGPPRPADEDDEQR